jgi:hypothetical protein
MSGQSIRRVLSSYLHSILLGRLHVGAVINTIPENSKATKEMNQLPIGFVTYHLSKFGSPYVGDLGEASYGQEHYLEYIQPYIRRAPEVISDISRL